MFRLRQKTGSLWRLSQYEIVGSFVGKELRHNEKKGIKACDYVSYDC